MPVTFRDLPKWKTVPNGVNRVLEAKYVACPECGYPLNADDVEWFFPDRPDVTITRFTGYCGNCDFART